MHTEISRLRRFYFLKIGGGNSLAEDWLAGSNLIERPAVVIFFGPVTLDEIRTRNYPAYLSTSGQQQVTAFVDSAERDDTCILVVDKRVTFMIPDGDLVEREPGDTETDSLDSIRKIMPIRVIEEKELYEVPAILAGIGANQYLVRGTYREITAEKNRGNLKAIYHVLGKKWESSWLDDPDPSGLFECLSSIELETLVARILEANGCFVPARRGGQLKHVDLFAYSDIVQDIDGLIVDEHGVQIQVKGNATVAMNDITDNMILVGYSCRRVDGGMYLDEQWLLNQVNTLSEVNSWLRRSLEWVPTDFKTKFLV